MNGKKITESTTFTPTKKTPKAMEKEAREFAREYEKQIREKEILSGEKLTFFLFVSSAYFSRDFLFSVSAAVLLWSSELSAVFLLTVTAGEFTACVVF